MGGCGNANLLGVVSTLESHGKGGLSPSSGKSARSPERAQSSYDTLDSKTWAMTRRAKDVWGGHM